MVNLSVTFINYQHRCRSYLPIYYLQQKYSNNKRTSFTYQKLYYSGSNISNILFECVDSCCLLIRLIFSRNPCSYITIVSLELRRIFTLFIIYIFMQNKERKSIGKNSNSHSNRIPIVIKKTIWAIF